MWKDEDDQNNQEFSHCASHLALELSRICCLHGESLSFMQWAVTVGRSVVSKVSVVFLRYSNPWHRLMFPVSVGYRKTVSRNTEKFFVMGKYEKYCIWIGLVNLSKCCHVSVVTRKRYRPIYITHPVW